MLSKSRVRIVMAGLDQLATDMFAADTEVSSDKVSTLRDASDVLAWWVRQDEVPEDESG